MNLYQLERIGHTHYDQVRSFVVRAESVEQARTLAAASAGDEGSACWLNPQLTTCNLVDGWGKAEVILCDFRAG